MRYFLDTEFIENGKTIDLISIGVVSEDNRLFYRLNWNCDFSAANDWVRENVLCHMPPMPLPSAKEEDRGLWRNHGRIGKELLDFVGDDKSPEFWADYGAYDWVAICQLFGTMMELPEGWPMFVRDIQQMKADFEPKDNHGYILLSFIDEWNAVFISPKDEHNALSDALECKRRFDVLSKQKEKVE